MFLKSEMFEKLLCCRRKVVEEDEAERGVEQVVLQHTNNNQTEYITSAQLVEVIMTLLLGAVSPAAGEKSFFVERKSFFTSRSHNTQRTQVSCVIDGQLYSYLKVWWFTQCTFLP